MSAKRTRLIGIYALINKATGRYYIGSTSCLRGFNRRFREHVRALQQGTHHSVFLQRDWKKCGADSFCFQILDVIPSVESSNVEYIREVEQMWLDCCDSVYNMTRSTEGGLEFVTDEHREKSNVKKKGRTMPNHVKEMLRTYRKGRPLSEEHKQKISEAQKGKKKNPESVKKMAKALTGRKQSPELVEKRVSKIRGKKRDETTVNKIVESRTKNSLYLVTFPDGTTVEVKNMAEFCREHNLSHGLMSQTATGKRKHHKHYSCKRVS